LNVAWRGYFEHLEIEYVERLLWAISERKIAKLKIDWGPTVPDKICGHAWLSRYQLLYAFVEKCDMSIFMEDLCWNDLCIIIASNKSKQRQHSSTASELDTSDNIDNQPVYPVFKTKR
jgi:hypothetical protein